MRLSLPALATLLLLTCPAMVRADVYDFNFTGSVAELTDQGIPNSYSQDFQVDTSMIIPVSPSNPGCSLAVPPDCFATPGTNYAYYQIYRDGLINEEDQLGESDSTSFTYYTDASQTTRLNLFTGPSTAPVITTGTYYAQFLFMSAYNPQGPVTITDLTTSAVPEPSTVELLGLGIVGLTSLARRRSLSA